MPTYQYSCTECGHFFEQVQSFSEDSLTVCPQCEGRLRKVFNAVGVVFKGSGFYRNDSREAKNGAGAKSDSDSAAAKNGAEGKDGKSEAAKTEAGSGSAKSADSPSAGKGSGESSAKGKAESAKPAASVAS